MRKASAAGSALHTGPNWVNLASATSPSISAQGLHVKPTAGLSNATKSLRVDGYVFVGTGKQSLAPIKSEILSILYMLTLLMSLQSR